MAKVKLDQQTVALIKELRMKETKGKLNAIDKQWLAGLLSGEKTIEDIKEEKSRCKEDYLYFINEHI
jgi:hypothetical protein